jgi:hypothetical protein
MSTKQYCLNNIRFSWFFTLKSYENDGFVEKKIPDVFNNFLLVSALLKNQYFQLSNEWVTLEELW